MTLFEEMEKLLQIAWGMGATAMSTHDARFFLMRSGEIIPECLLSIDPDLHPEDVVREYTLDKDSVRFGSGLLDACNGIRNQLGD